MSATLTIELPEPVAHAFAPLTEEEQKHYASAWLIAGLNNSELSQESNDDDLMPLSEEDIAAVNRGIDDLFAGRHRSLEEVIAHQEAYWNTRGLSLKNARRK